MAQTSNAFLDEDISSVTVRTLSIRDRAVEHPTHWKLAETRRTCLAGLFVSVWYSQGAVGDVQHASESTFVAACCESVGSSADARLGFGK